MQVSISIVSLVNCLYSFIRDIVSKSMFYSLLIECLTKVIKVHKIKTARKTAVLPVNMLQEGCYKKVNKIKSFNG